MKLGDFATISKRFDKKDVLKFSELSGDSNPIHLDENFAKNTIFGKCIVHGALAGSLISNLLGTKLPGTGTIYLEQHTNYIAPVFVGDTVTATVRIIDVDALKKIYTFETICETSAGKVISGQAKVLYKS